MIPAIGLLAGVLLGLILHPTVPVWLQPYLPIAVVAAPATTDVNGVVVAQKIARRLANLPTRWVLPPSEPFSAR